MNLKSLFNRALDTIKPSEDTFAKAFGTMLVGVGIIYATVLMFSADWLAFILFLPGLALLFGLTAFEPLQQRFLNQTFNLLFAFYIVLYWVYITFWLFLFRLLLVTPAIGKESQLFYVTLLAFLAVTWAIVRTLLMILRPAAYKWFSTSIPLWEQILLVTNEGTAIGLFAFVWGAILVRLFQPFVFTTRLNIVYGLGLGGVALFFYIIIQLMWVQSLNEWLSLNRVWIVLARVFSPFVLFVASMLIMSRFTERIDPRTASLLNGGDIDLAVLALAPVIWLMLFVMMIVVFTSDRGLRQRFLPDTFLEKLPNRIQLVFRSISDMDLLLIIGVLTTFTPVYLLLLGDGSGILGTARTLILQRGRALIETSEQALAILFVLPFYVFIMLILLLYAFVVSRAVLPARERDTLMQNLPVGFLIALIITLYLFAVPFTQVFTEGRLPTFSRDLGRILAFYVFVPLLLLYAHYFFLVRFPYARGQRLWRERYALTLEQDLQNIDRRIRNLNQELGRIDNRWQLAGHGNEIAKLQERIETLHRYIHLNGERDDLNMQRLQIVSARQNLAEISETPFSLSVARLPLRIISIGIPLLLVFQLYQWAVLNEGLQDVVNNPNITVADFIKIILDNIEF